MPANIKSNSFENVINPGKLKYKEKNFIELFYEQVSTNPSGIAVVMKDQRMTYGELNEKSDKLAQYIKSLGFGVGSLIGLCTLPNMNFIICMIGILKSGGVYFPLDPLYPEERLKFMLNDGKPSLIFSESKYTKLFAASKGLVIDTDKQLDRIFKSSLENMNFLNGLSLDSLAYVIYTSGSTGKPKGIMITHKSLPNVALAHNQYYPSGMKMLIAGGVCFDATLLVIFHALVNGDQLCLFNYNPKDDVSDLLDFVTSNKVGYLISVPSQYARLLEKKRKLSHLKCVSLTGENLPNSLCEQHAKFAPNAILYNEYGPTECAIGTSIAKIYDPEDRIIHKVTVGHPLPNTQVYILDQNLKKVRIGKKGEIYIGGVGLARGYLNNPKLTAEKFVQVKFAGQNAIRLYKTGDFGRILAKGEMEFLGRTEHRVQIKGKWIDLGEVEYHISRCPDVKESVLLVKMNADETQQLVAFITSAKISAKTSLMDFLQKYLPKYMMPSLVIRVDKFPLSPNGKIDRDVLGESYV